MDKEDIKIRKNGMPLASSVQVDERINAIVDLYLQGVTRLRDIRTYSENENWQVGDRALEKYMTRARKILQKSAEAKRETEIGKAIGRYELLFYKSYKVQDYKVALAAQRALCELLGLNAPAKTAMTDTEGNIIPTSVTVEIVTTKEKATDE